MEREGVTGSTTELSRLHDRVVILHASLLEAQKWCQEVDQEVESPERARWSPALMEHITAVCESVRKASAAAEAAIGVLRKEGALKS